MSSNYRATDALLDDAVLACIGIRTVKILANSDSNWANVEEVKSQASFSVFMAGQGEF